MQKVIFQQASAAISMKQLILQNISRHFHNMVGLHCLKIMNAMELIERLAV